MCAVARRLHRDAAARQATFPLEAFRMPQAGWPLELGPGRLTDRRRAGEIDGASWYLRFDAREEPFVYTPTLSGSVLRVDAGRRREAGLAVSGVVEIDGVPRARRRAGQQAHLLGRRHADRWGWFHASLGTAAGSKALWPSAGLPRVAFYAASRRRPAECSARGRARAGASASARTWSRRRAKRSPA